RPQRRRPAEDRSRRRRGPAGVELEPDRPMSGWSLPKILGGLHDDIERRLGTAREALGHPGTKGDASEHVWLDLLQTYLPRRYSAERAHVVDSKGEFSQQIDVLVFDRQYSPFIFHYEGQTVVPAESVYAAFEAKQAIDAGQVDYAQKKVASVRRLYRTSLPIPYAEGPYRARPHPHFRGGPPPLESAGRPPLGAPLLRALSPAPGNRLALGCVAAHGIFPWDAGGLYTVTPQGKPATAFL